LAIERWDPFREMTSRFFEPFFRPFERTTSMGYGVPIDVCETNDEYFVQAAIPGVRPEDLDISVKEDTVTIRGELRAPEWLRGEGAESARQPGTQSQQTGQYQGTQQGQSRGQQQMGRTHAGAACWLQEIPYGRFSRSVTLPTPINGNNARADFDNGLLTLHLPKTEEARPRRIEVHAGTHQQQVGTGSTTGQTQR